VSNLIEKSGHVMDLMDQLKGIDNQQETFRRIESRASQVQAVRVKLDGLLASRTLLNDCKIPNAPPKSASISLKKKGQILTSDLSKGWEKFADDKTLKTQFIDPVGLYADKIKKALEVGWEKYVSKSKPDVPKTLINSLSASGFGEKVETLRELLDEINDLAGSLPLEKRQVERIAVASEEAKALIYELDGIPDAVRVFLTKATNGTALLSDLTEEVRSWLTKHGMLTQLRVRFGE
jgi:hypothetical protein